MLPSLGPDRRPGIRLGRGSEYYQGRRTEIVPWPDDRNGPVPIRSMHQGNPLENEGVMIMSWTETNLRQRTLREVAAHIENDSFARLPWNDGYAELFGDETALVNALRCRWNRLVEAQLDPDLPEYVLDELRSGLMADNAGLRRLLARYSAAGRLDVVEELEFEHAS